MFGASYDAVSPDPGCQLRPALESASAHCTSVTFIGYSGRDGSTPTVGWKTSPSFHTTGLLERERRNELCEDDVCDKSNLC